MRRDRGEVTHATISRPFSTPRRSNASPSRPPTSTPMTAPAPSASISSVGERLVQPYCWWTSSTPNVCDPGEVEVAAGARNDHRPRWSGSTGCSALRRPGPSGVAIADRARCRWSGATPFSRETRCASVSSSSSASVRRPRRGPVDASRPRGICTAPGGIAPAPPRTGSGSFSTAHGEHERRDREDHERRPPRHRGDVTGDGEADAGAEQLAGQNVAPDPAPLRAHEPVAEHRCDDRPGRCRRDAEARAASASVRRTSSRWRSRSCSRPTARSSSPRVVVRRMPVGEARRTGCSRSPRRPRSPRRADRCRRWRCAARDAAGSPTRRPSRSPRWTARALRRARG